jgi:heptosyltransferase-2
VAEFRRILVLRGGALGDFILTLPVLKQLRCAWPQAHIELIADARFLPLATAGGLADAVYALDDAAMVDLFMTAAPLSADRVRFFAAFDLILCYLHDPDGVVAAQLRRAAAGRVICHSPLFLKGHAIDHFLAPLRTLGLQAATDAGAALQLPTETSRRGEELLKPFGRNVVVIHPGSGSAWKNWPLVHYAALSLHIRSTTEYTPLFLLGEAERGWEARIHALARGVAMIGCLPLLDVAATLSACAAYIGNDSGVTHLAAAIGAPVVAIFCQTDPAVWAPRGANVEVVSSFGSGSKTQAMPDALSVFNAFCTVKRNRRRPRGKEDAAGQQ